MLYTLAQKMKKDGVSTIVLLYFVNYLKNIIILKIYMYLIFIL